VGKITEPAEVKDKTGKQFTSAQESLKKKAPKVVENI
jgi:hypothetical protein